MPRSRRLSGCLPRLALLAFSLLLMGLLAEVALRVVAPRPEGRPDLERRESGPRATPKYLPSPDMGWVLQPDVEHPFRARGFDTTVTANGLGLRGEPIDRDEATFRVVVLGDSYAFGWGVEDDQTYAVMLQRHLTSSARRVQVINGALPGFGTHQRRASLERLLELGIGAVVLDFSVANDVVDDWRIEPYLPDDLLTYQQDLDISGGLGTRRFSAWERWWGDHSRVISAARRGTLYPRFWVLGRTRGNLQRTRTLLADLLDRCQELGIPAVMVLNPARSQIAGEGLLARLAHGWSHAPNRMARKLAEQRNVPLIDVETLFRARDPDALYLHGDPHWTPLGHEIVAGALMAVLVDRVAP